MGSYTNRSAVVGGKYVKPSAPQGAPISGGDAQQPGESAKAYSARIAPAYAADFQATEQSHVAPGLKGAPELYTSLQRILAQPARANPFSRDAANASAAAQTALLAQMRQQAAGPSLTALQGQQGLSRLGQQSLTQGGRAGMLGAQGAGAGMAADVGRARLMEALKAQAELGTGAGRAIGQDQTVQGLHQSQGLKQQQIDQEREIVARGLLTGLTGAQLRDILESRRIAIQRQENRDKNEAWGENLVLEAAKNFLAGMATG